MDVGREDDLIDRVREDVEEPRKDAIDQEGRECLTASSTEREWRAKRTGACVCTRVPSSVDSRRRRNRDCEQV